MDSARSSTSPSDAAPNAFSTLTHYGAIDWGRGKHQLCVVDAAGKVVLEQGIDNSPEAWAELRARLARIARVDGSPAVVGFAIETNCGPAVERLLEAGVAVFPLNPRAAERYRDRKTWPAPANASGRSSCTPTGSTARTPRPNALSCSTLHGSRRGTAMPGHALAENPLENVAATHAL